MQKRSMVIDVWNGDSKRHLGSCTVPLAQLLRQGKKEKVIKGLFQIL